MPEYYVFTDFELQQYPELKYYINRSRQEIFDLLSCGEDLLDSVKNIINLKELLGSYEYYPNLQEKIVFG